jgi:hypothetical protein
MHSCGGPYNMHDCTFVWYNITTEVNGSWYQTSFRTQPGNAYDSCVGDPGYNVNMTKPCFIAFRNHQLEAATWTHPKKSTERGYKIIAIVFGTLFLVSMLYCIGSLTLLKCLRVYVCSCCGASFNNTRKPLLSGNINV